MSNIISTSSNISFTMPPSGVQLMAAYEQLSYFTITSDGRISASEYLKSQPVGSVDLVIPRYINEKYIKDVIPRGFYQCKSLKSLKISAGIINTIGFSECTSLEIADVDVQAIESGAFDGCSALVRVTISSAISNISQGAFSGCKNLHTINIDGIKDSFKGAPWGCPDRNAIKWRYTN